MKAWIVDTFTSECYLGNPAAVCEHEGLTGRAMQSAATSLGQPATAFLERLDTRCFSIRWFTPTQELEICGHATVASACYAHDVVGISPTSPLQFVTATRSLHAQARAGLVSIDLPAVIATETELPHRLEGVLGVEIIRCSRAERDLIIEVASEDVVRRIRPAIDQLGRIDCDGSIVTARSERVGVDFVSRSFLPSLGVNEDHVCVSAHSWLGPYWAPRLGRQRLVAEQLSARGGRLVLDVGPDEVRVAGAARVRGRAVA